MVDGRRRRAAIVSAPPMNHSTPTKVIADRTAEKTPIGELDRRVARHAQILGDAILGVGVIAGNQVELVVAALAEPAIEHVARSASRASCAACVSFA